MIDVSHFAKSLNGKPVAVYGLGLSGLATVEALVAGDITVYAWDDAAEKVEAAKAKGAICQNLDETVLKQCVALILSPGVPLTHPEPHAVVTAANKAGLEIIGDIEVLHRCNHGHKTVGITGTNGKSTTTALMTHVLNSCRHPAQMGGNIGVPALALDDGPKDAIYVLEMSSYQIDLCPTFKPDIGVLLNITPDHIDRHGSFENYAAIKERLLNGAKHPVRGRAEEKAQTVLKGFEFQTLPGAHNAQNIMAVLDVCEILKIDKEKAIKAIQSFPGLAHRQYLARKIGAVSYINDSKATNAEATSKALSSYQNIYWIVGGQAKDGGLNGLEQYKDRISCAYLIGESEPAFELWMKMQGIEFNNCETLENAVSKAHQSAQESSEDAVVLLSPACASWDQFKSFEHRGDVFCKLVEALK